MQKARNIFLLVVLTTTIISWQFKNKKDSTRIKGKVFSKDSNFKPFSFSGIMYEKHQDDEPMVFSAFKVDSLGHFSKSFPKNAKLALTTSYQNYYNTDTIIYTGNEDEINITFEVFPKQYYYTEHQAKKDISNGLVQIVLFDSVLFGFNEKLKYTEKFGFDYKLETKPIDYEFERNIDLYNYQIEEHLFQKDSTWMSNVLAIEDSLIHLEADEYGKSHAIDLDSLSIPDWDLLPEEMQKAIKEKKSELERLFRENKDEVLSNDPEFVLKKIDTKKDYQPLFIAEYWMAYNYKYMIPELITRVTSKKEIGLKNSADLIIWERIKSGDLEFWGHGGIVDDDLFTVAGRANHLLSEITGQNFGNVSMYSSEKDLMKLQKRWLYWFLKLNANR